MVLTKTQIKRELEVIQVTIGYIASPKGHAETGEKDFEEVITHLNNLKGEVRLYFEEELAGTSTEKQKEAIIFRASEFQKTATRISGKLESLKVIQTNYNEFSVQARSIFNEMKKLVDIFL